MIKIPSARKTALVPLDRITPDNDFWFRSGDIDAAHKADLARTISNTGKPLDPVLLWQPEGEDSQRLILLDGAHRIEAYKAANWSDSIPATILIGADRREALGAALKANSALTLGLSQAERMDAAWRLVREPVVPRFRVREIVALANVAGRTVDNMRRRHRTMHEEGIEITGSWARDQRTLPQGDADLDRMSDARRKAEIAKLAGDLRDLIDRRKHPERAILREREAVWEAVQEALGERTMKTMLVYLLGDDEEANEWLEMASARDEDWDENGEGDEPEPAF